MSDPAIWVVWHAGGPIHGAFMDEDSATHSAACGFARHCTKYIPAPPEVTNPSGEPCTVIATSEYERLKAAAEKWAKVEGAIRELGIL